MDGTSVVWCVVEWSGECSAERRAESKELENMLGLASNIWRSGVSSCLVVY